MAYAKRTYTPGSSTTTFALTTSGGSPIGYIQESDITVKVNGTTYTNAASGTSTYQISGSSTVEQPNGGNVVLNAGVTGTVILERVTAFQDATVVYTAGSTLTSTDLNNADNQIRFSLQEFDDKYASLTSGTGTLPDLGAFLGSSDTWVSNNSKAATSAAIDARSDTKIATALTGDVVGTAPVTIADNSPSSGKITIAVDAKLTELSTMAQTTANALADLTQSEVEILDGITATTAEINYVDGVTSNVQTQLNAKQGSATDLTTLSSCQSNAASALAALTQAEIQILDGATVSTGELNVLDGIPNTLSATELGYVDGVTSSIQNQLNAKQPLDAELTELATMSSGTASSLADLTGTEAAILDGATLSVTELNYVDGVTSAIQTQIDAKQPLDSELSTLAGMQGGTASILAAGTALGATTTEINSICENRASQTTITDDDAKIPTSGAVVDYVAAQIAPIGGLEVVATEVAFPNTQPASGVVISISDAGGVVVNGSGVSTTGRTVGSSTVTINGFPSSLYSETLAVGVGLMVSSTGSSQTYTYHKLLAKEGDVKQLSDDINDFNERYRVSNGAPSGTDHAGDLYYDTGSDKMLVRNAANNAWEEVQSIGNFYISTLSPAFNGSLEDFTVSNAPSNAQQLLISINGILQKPNSGTSRPSEGFALNGSTVLFSDPPANGSDYFAVVIGSSVNIGTPSNNTVSTAILQNGSVTNEKVNASAAIVGSKLADDSIAEVKLDVHNAPSGTDKFLAYTSNGMEWAVPTTISFANDANNRVVTGTGSGLNGEANLTFDGTKLVIDSDNSFGNVVISRDGGAGGRRPFGIGISGSDDDHLRIAVSNDTSSANAFTNQVIDIDSSGNVGIGTTSPTTILNVSGSSSPQIKLNSTDASPAIFVGDANRSSDGQHLAEFRGHWNGTSVARIVMQAGDDTTNKDNGQIVFFTAAAGSTSECMRLDESGNVGIGTTSPAVTLEVEKTIDVNWSAANSIVVANNLLRLENPSTNNSAFAGMQFRTGDGGDAYFGSYQNNSSANDCTFYWSNQTNSGAKTLARLDTASGNLTVEDGDLVIETAGHGINFHPHSGTANLLSDYEEGSWSPSISYGTSNSGLNVTESAGLYVKVGRFIHLSAMVGWDEGSCSGPISITGLPYVTKNNSNTRLGGHAIYLDGFNDLSGSNIFLYATGNSSTASMYFVSGSNNSQLGPSDSAVTHSVTSSGNTTRFVISYYTDS